VSVCYVAEYSRCNLALVYFAVSRFYLSIQYKLMFSNSCYSRNIPPTILSRLVFGNISFFARSFIQLAEFLYKKPVRYELFRP